MQIAAPDDVDDRVDGADLVELHVLRRSAVHLRLRAGEAIEDREGARLRSLRQGAALDHRAYIAVGAMLVPLPMAARRDTQAAFARDEAELYVGAQAVYAVPGIFDEAELPAT